MDEVRPHYHDNRRGRPRGGGKMIDFSLLKLKNRCSGLGSEIATGRWRDEF